MTADGASGPSHLSPIPGLSGALRSHRLHTIMGGRLHLIQGWPAFLEADGSGGNIWFPSQSCYFSKFFRSTVARGVTAAGVLAGVVGR